MSNTNEPVVVVTPEPALTPDEKTKADALFEHVRARMLEETAKATIASTRPTFGDVTPSIKANEVAEDRTPVLKRGYLPAPTNMGEKPADLAARLMKSDEGGNIYINRFPAGDIDNFSVTRWSMAVQRSMNTTEGALAFSRYAPWESKYYEALDYYAKATLGDQVSGQDGGFLAPELWSTNFIDMIYAAQVLRDLPITRLNMGTRVTHMPKLTGAVTVNYTAENASISASSPQFSQLSFTARKQSALMQISNELIRDSNPTADDILRNHASTYMALDRDKQILIGNGQGGAPVGLASATNFTTTTLGTNASPLYSEFIKGMYNVENLNGSTNVPVGQTQCTGVVGQVALKQQILALVDSNGRPMYDFTGLNALRGAFPNSGGGQFDGVLGIPTWRFTNILGAAANSRYIFFGDWQHLYLMQRQDVEIMASNVAGTAFQNDQTWVRLISRYDVGVAHPEAFFAYTND